MTTIGDSAPRRNLWAKCMTMVGVLIAAANMGFGWKIMLENRPSMRHITQAAIPAAMTPVPATHLIERIHEINVTAIWKEAAHQYAISTVGLAFSFGLLAVGFALFVMGIESAFNLKGEHKEIGTVALKATSPGIICFFLAALLIAITLLRPHTYDVPSGVLPPELLKVVATGGR